MHSSSLLLALSAIVGISGAATPPGASVAGKPVRAAGAANSTASNNATSSAPASKRFIIEIAEGADHTSAATLLSARPGTKIISSFNSPGVFSGFSVETDGENLDSLQGLTPVSKAWHAKEVGLLAPVPGSVAKRAVPPAAGNWSVHAMTGVDKLHAQGLTGKGVKIAVIDTGIDYTHPALGGCFGAGCKVVGGYDFGGEGDFPNWGALPLPDADPIDEYGHGTHVAGIIAGKTDWFTGVAPDATLLAYKVTGLTSSTTEDVLIQAFLQAYEDGADIITCSMGGDDGWSDGPWATVASRLVEQGVLVTIAAGNSGENGPFLGSNGASGEFVLAVAAVEGTSIGGDPISLTFHEATGVNTTVEVGYQYGHVPIPKDASGLQIIPLNLNIDDEFSSCYDLPADTPDFTGAIALVRRAVDCNFDTQYTNLRKHGASYVLFYNSDLDSLVIPLLSLNQTAQVGMIDYSVGKDIIETVQGGGKVTGDFSIPVGTRYVNQDSYFGGIASPYSSMYSTNMLEQKPDIAAPGGTILSSYLDHSWATMSGTSMATPYIAGIAALWMEKYGGRIAHPPSYAKDLAMRFIASGRTLKWVDAYGYDTTDVFSPTIQHGTGLVDAQKVLGYTTTLSYSKFNLNDTKHFSRYQNVDITNGGNSDVTYTFELQACPGFETWTPYDEFIDGSPRFRTKAEVVPYDGFEPRVKFPSGTFNVKAGQTKTASFIFEYPAGKNINASNIPAYSGKILIHGSSGEELAVPYFGVAADLSNDLNNSYPGYPYAYTGFESWGNQKSLDEKNTITFNLSEFSQDFIHIMALNRWATQEMRLDIFQSGWKERDWQYPPVEGKNGFVGSAATWSKVDLEWAVFFNPDVHNVNDTYSYPLRHTNSRVPTFSGEWPIYWMGKLANGSFIQPGNYYMRWGVVDPLSDPNHPDNWQTLGHEIKILSTYTLS